MVNKTRNELLEEPLIDGMPNLNEADTFKGNKYTQIQEYVIDIATPLYVLYEVPPGSTASIELIKRTMKSDSNGVDYQILWDYDVSTATKTPLTIYNENNAFRSVKDAQFEVSLLNASTLDASTGIRTITGAATIVDQGIVREPGFISASGVGANTTGDIDPDLGFRLYAPGTGYLFKVTSRGDANKVIIGYTVTEAEV